MLEEGLDVACKKPKYAHTRSSDHRRSSGCGQGLREE